MKTVETGTSFFCILNAMTKSSLTKKSAKKIKKATMNERINSRNR